MPMRGKVAIVTGAGSGIGRATAIAFAREGAHVVLADINGAEAQRTAKQLGAGVKHLVVQVDVSKVADGRRMVAEAYKTFGRVDALANVAAIYPRLRVLEMTEELWDRTMAVNLRGLFFCCQAAMRVMAEQGSGAIVNIASGSAFRPIEGLAAYSAAKGGVVAVSRVLALEGIKRGVRTNVVAPGATETEGLHAMFGEQGVRDVGAGMIGGKIMTPMEIAPAIVFLCSDEASGVNGAILNVNRGDYMIS